MSAHPIWYVGNRNPSITEVITDSAEVPIDLNSPVSTVRFKARLFGSSTLIVDQPATIVQTGSGGAAVNPGAVRYDWSAADVAANGILHDPHEALVWWEVTTGGKTQDLMEATIEVQAHAPQALTYVELEEFKSTLELTNQTYADSDAQSALVAASRGIDNALGRRFYLDANANQVRYFTPTSEWELPIDDLTAVTSVEIDRGNDGTYEELWVKDIDYQLGPVNASLDGKPYTELRVIRGTTNFALFPIRYRDRRDRPVPVHNSVKVTGQFGWPAVPEGIKVLTTLMAQRVMRRTREAPFGIIAYGIDGASVKISQIVNDPEYRFLVASLQRRKLFQ